MVPGAEPIWIAFDRREERTPALGWENKVLKNFLFMSSIIASI